MVLGMQDNLVIIFNEDWRLSWSLEMIGNVILEV